jgi:hypothetical protein
MTSWILDEVIISEVINAYIFALQSLLSIDCPTP